MKLERGTRIGPYQLASPIGEGGMGVVYRAHDDRLQRDVAIKFMSETFSGDSTRTRLMQQEARAASKLSHPNIVAVFDVGTHQGLMYVVTELLEGESLRELVSRGPTAWKIVLGLAAQIADGLAAAHEQGIIHRDIKPDNVFLTRDGRIKILDFGVATLRPTEGSLATAQTVSQSGLLIGTVGYMSPEQTRGEKVDPRSDLFAFGCLIYELIAGKPAFPGGSAIAILAAIQRDTPTPLDELVETVRDDLVRIVDRCLEKDPAKRFQSARDLLFALTLVETGRQPARAEAPPPPMAESSTAQEASPRWSRRTILGVSALLLADSAISIAAFRALAPKPKATKTANAISSAESAPFPSFKPITFQRGTVYTARFTLEGNAIVYSAEWEGRTRDLFLTVPGTRDSRSLGQPATDVAYLLAAGEVAVLRRPGGGFSPGLLARLSLAGGPAKDLIDAITWADGSPDGARIAILRRANGKAIIEMPPGKTLVETPNASNLRLSPDGAHLAYLEYSGLADDSGKLVVIDATGKRIAESEDWNSTEGVGWRSNTEVWFTAVKQGRSLSLLGMDLLGNTRLLCRVAGRMVLHDVARDGRVIAERNNYRSNVMVGTTTDGKETNLGWQDFPQLAQLSRDGKQVLFTEIGDGAGAGSVAYLRSVVGGPPLRLGEGFALALSGDGGQALLRITTQGGPSSTTLELTPIGSGHSVRLPMGTLDLVSWASFVPNSSKVVLLAREGGKGHRLYLQDTTLGDPRPISEEGVRVESDALSPDGTQVAATQNGKVVLVPLDGGAVRTLPALTADHLPLAWTADGKSLFIRSRNVLTIELFRYELSSGKLTPFRTLATADPAGVIQLGRVSIARDGEVYAYESYQLLSDLYVIEGLG